VIQAFNQAHDVRELLKKHGYEPKGTDRFIAPGSTSGLAGIKVFDDGRAYSHHGSDPLANGHSHDPFSVSASSLIKET
jgi:putative DNA primase/helicase